jgi:hypothetical protein
VGILLISLSGMTVIIYRLGESARVLLWTFSAMLFV